MKLNLLFIVMDLLTFLAYPIVLGRGLLRQLWRSRTDRARARSRSADSAGENG